MDIQMLDAMEPWTWPEEAGQIILDVLNDSDAEGADRLLATRLAGDMVVVNEDIVTALLAILRDEDAEEVLRAKAAISMGPVLEEADTMGFDDPEDVPIGEHTFHEIQHTLKTVYTDAGAPKLVRRRVLEAAVRAGEPWQKDAVRAAFASGDPEWILTAVFSMEWAKGFDAQILASLDSEDENIRYHAVRAAGNWELDEAWSTIKHLALSPDTEKALRIAAIEAMGAIRPQEAGEYLVDVADDEDEDIAAAADETMLMAEAESGFGEDWD